MTAPSTETMSAAVVDYLRLRRALGHQLEADGRLLAGFAAHLDAAGIAHLRVHDALAWSVAGSSEVGAAAVAHRLSAIRTFARYLAAFDPATEVPPAELAPMRIVRRTPYIFTASEISALLHAAGRLRSHQRSATFTTLIGLMAATGIRTAEALRLETSDVVSDVATDADGDVDGGVEGGGGQLLVRCSKFGKTRHLPLHVSTGEALQDYLASRDEGASTLLFTSPTGQRLDPARTFHLLLAEARITVASGRRTPRLHDLRHTFAVNTLRDWHAAGVDVEQRLAVLSTYLGHVNPAYTYWYLQAVPELMGVLADRLETYLDGGAA